MKIFLSSKADKQLKKLLQKMHGLIVSKIDTLGSIQTPRGSKKLAGRNGWRIRVGDYRVLYTVDKTKKEVTVLSVTHRKDAYKF